MEKKDAIDHSSLSNIIIGNLSFIIPVDDDAKTEAYVNMHPKQTRLIEGE